MKQARTRLGVGTLFIGLVVAMNLFIPGDGLHALDYAMLAAGGVLLVWGLWGG